ncbi:MULTISPECIES: helix-turn-helix transcriptional regulator [Alphaproteobacteria]|uniref:HTH luxR-type domain-containing protein n=2 Tax=Alphaproteobacteria TaxID=28211 RepID=A0A512HCJ3_9HYPH|nr:MULTISPECIES: helix-turn-helix domain-containing protein [Alphaproteobacteria]GEO83162.1 hypothetical protein RNA01_00940 [Ciceribacter naphthalenivorans]GLR20443.1 hypothetical protein GCM10007920_02270 [Ciceribacter naphthalenivorans]GLT03299.1 hypothetical protein GCM10007926_02270 [Sphingomonas psychrolutea]
MDWDSLSSSGEKDILVGIHAAENLSEIGAVITLLLRRFDFRFFKLFSSRGGGDSSLRGQLLLYSVPEAFLDDFDAIGGLPPAPLGIMGAEERFAYQWHVDVLADAALHDPAKRRLMEVLAAHGMERGAYAVLPTVDGRKHIFGVYGRAESLSPAQMDEFSLLAIRMLDRMEGLEKSRGWPQNGLSGLEFTCLELAAEGMDSSAIARRLSLSIRTVNYLTCSLCRKLGTDRLEQALIEAVRLGYID